MIRILVFCISLILGLGSAYAVDTFTPPTGERLQRMLADFETYAINAMKDWQTPGMAVAIIQGDKVVYAKGFGVKEIGKPEKVDTNTVFQVGSTTKAFTAALVSMMVDEDKFGWRDKVVDLLPEFMLYDPWVTRQFEVVDLMAQRSGLPAYAGDDQSTLGFDRQHIINSLRYMRPSTSFRSEYAYQNSFFLVAAKLIEQSTGKTWEVNLQERIFGPLGMKNSSASLESFKAAANRASPHHKVDGKVVPIPTTQRGFNWNYIYGPAGGINSTVNDMAQWVKLQLANGKFGNNQLISAENVQFMHEPKTYINEAVGAYCLAWVRTDYQPYPLIWHNGGTPGIHALVQIIPQGQLGIVVLSNLGNTALPESLGRRFADMYFGNPPRDWSRLELAKVQGVERDTAAALKPRASATPPLPLSVYAGTYSNPVYGDAVVTVENNKLVMTVGPNRIRLTLVPWNRDIFQVNEKDIELQSMVEFRIGSDGKASGVTVSDFNEAGEGFFDRSAVKR